MSKDLHLKRQKQIRMSDEVRERFEAAQAESGMTGEEFVVYLLDNAAGGNASVSYAVAAELEKMAAKIRSGLK